MKPNSERFGRPVPATWRVVLVFVLGCLFGGRLRKWLYRKLCGYRIARDAIIGHAYIQVSEAMIGQGARIGTLTVIRNLEHLVLKDGARIGTFNWVFGMLPSTTYFVDEPERFSALILETEASLTSRHIIDATNTVTIGEFATVAGFRSQILTHGIDVASNRQRSAKIVIGENSMIGTGAIILKGSRIPSRSIVAAGSTFRGDGGEPGGLWSGVPAQRVGEMDINSQYFHRRNGHVL